MRSPVHTFTPLLGAQLDLDAHAELDIEVDPTFEHGVLCDVGDLELAGTALAAGDLGYQGPDNTAVHVRNVGHSRRDYCCWAAHRLPKNW
ncbi:hypothetical protein I551_0106 [Mycobacterium ulcerans str. Harvey]|uniref:Uncharacterized protein n=1 Tax=Mycobacterium ulcerans str. Harvey TaxID=1299332 RepID=A0ABN0R8H4_MYCUL|nr:hypothetical protein I551_0106 [Mycobacterium ulcerans str. Harvey]